MKQFMTVSLCILASVLAFSACTKNETVSDAAGDVLGDSAVTVTDVAPFVSAAEQTVVGSWQCEKDLSDMMNEQFVTELEGFSVDSFTMLINLDITDNTLTMNAELDPESLDSFADAVIAYAKDMFAESGLDMDEDMIADAMDIEGLKEGLKEGFVTELEDHSSAYCIEGNKLVSVNENGEKVEDDYVTYELDGNTLILTGTAATGDEVDALFPLVFTRV